MVVALPIYYQQITGQLAVESATTAQCLYSDPHLINQVQRKLPSLETLSSMTSPVQLLDQSPPYSQTTTMLQDGVCQPQRRLAGES